MRKLDLDLTKFFERKGTRDSQKEFNTSIIDRIIKDDKKEDRMSQKINIKAFSSSIVSYIKKLWSTPEVRIIFFIILTRIFFVLFTHWGMDFDWYIKIAEEASAGKKLYIDIDSTHMPLVDFIYIAMYAICPWKSSIIALRLFMKFPFILSDIGMALAALKIIEKEQLRKMEEANNLSEETLFNIKRLKLNVGYFIAFCIPLIFQTGGGRYDSLMIFCFVMAVYNLQRNNWFGMGFFAALGSSAKYIGIIFIPFVIFWLKKEDIMPFLLGLVIGFIPIYPFLFTIPHEFIAAVLLRGSHIAYGFAIWHLVFIIWNNFEIKYVDGIESTYDSSGEPWFVKDLYLPMFVLIYSTILVIYLVKYWRIMRTNSIINMPLSSMINVVFIPLFIFAISFKAINIQVLAWFIPYIAFKKKKGLLIEYTALTLIHGLALIIYEAYNYDSFIELSKLAASEGSIFYTIVVKPAIAITEHIPSTVWVAIITITIIWYIARTTTELVKSTKELLVFNSSTNFWDKDYVINTN
ncbi:MAG: hypothetical protein FK734_05710 [Asgard group archaeon]|nr:hypothetical protein [Asgard group archaeon]